MTEALLVALGETGLMVAVAGALAVPLGLLLGLALFVCAPGQLWLRPVFHAVTSTLVNGVRALPFIILLVSVIPLTRWLTGTSIGTVAAIVPLTLTAAPFVARLYEESFRSIDPQAIEAARSFGATRLQVVWRVMLPEAIPSLVAQTTVMVVSLIGGSAMAGAVGGGGLGDLGIRYGYQRFQPAVMIAVVVTLIVVVSAVQWLGGLVSRRLSR